MITSLSSPPLHLSIVFNIDLEARKLHTHKTSYSMHSYNDTNSNSKDNNDAAMVTVHSAPTTTTITAIIIIKEINGRTSARLTFPLPFSERLLCANSTKV